MVDVQITSSDLKWCLTLLVRGVVCKLSAFELSDRHLRH